MTPPCASSENNALQKPGDGSPRPPGRTSPPTVTDSGLGTSTASSKVEIEAVRAGYTSWQKQSRSVDRAGYGLNYGKYGGISMAYRDPNLGLTARLDAGESGWNASMDVNQRLGAVVRTLGQDEDLTCPPANPVDGVLPSRLLPPAYGPARPTSYGPVAASAWGITCPRSGGSASSGTKPCSRPTESAGWSAGIAI